MRAHQRGVAPPRHIAHNVPPPQGIWASMKGARDDAVGKASNAIAVLDLCNACCGGIGDDAGGRHDVCADG